MEKKTVNLKEIVQDINSGMHATQLMVKHELSPGQLAKVMEKLEAMGHIQQGARPAEPPVAHTGGTPRISCPNCRTIIPEDLDDCPRCGVVLSRYRQTAPPTESAEHRIRSAASRAVALSPAVKSQANYTGKTAALAIVAAMLLVSYGTYRWFKSGLEAAQMESNSVLVQIILQAVDQGTPDYFTLAKKLANAAGDNVIKATKGSSNSPATGKLGEIHGMLLTLGNLKSQLELREATQRTTSSFAVERSRARILGSENLSKQYESQLKDIDAALKKAQKIANQYEKAASMSPGQKPVIIMDRGGSVVHTASGTQLSWDGKMVDVEELELKRQEILGKMAPESATAAAMEAQKPAASEVSQAVEDDAQAMIEDLKEQLDAGQQQLVSLCHEYLVMAGKSPAPETSQ